MTKKVRLLVLGSVLALCPAFVAQAADKTLEQLVVETRAAIKEASIQDVKKIVDAKEKAIIIDIRNKKDYEEEHIPGAVNIPTAMNVDADVLIRYVNALTSDKTAAIIVYCMYDKKSPFVTKVLNEHGYTNAVSMAGGLEAWEDAKYPMVEKQ